MDYEDLIATILAGVIILAFVIIVLYWFFKFGIKQIEVEYKVKKAQLRFYESASKLIEKDLVDNGNNESNKS